MDDQQVEKTFLKLSSYDKLLSMHISSNTLLKIWLPVHYN